MTDLFNSKTVNKLCQDIDLTKKQKESANQWLKLLKENKLEKEQENYRVFGDLILRDLLNYTEEEIRGGTNKDKMEFHFTNSEGKKILCFEVKGTKTKDLFAMQHRSKKEHSTPIHQTWDYMGEYGMNYGICTNYKDFILITKEFGYSKCHIFNFDSIKSNEKNLKEFVGIFSKERIIEKGFVEKLQKESIIEEREFTKEFYKLFHETRLMLIKAFQEKENVSKNEAIYYTQLFLNRLIFMFFVSDKGFIPDRQLFTNRILHILESGQSTEHSKKIYYDIKELFIAFDKGSRVLGVFGFNGGMFNGVIPEKIYFSDLKDDGFFDDVKQNSQLAKSTKLNEKAFKTISKISNLNPIISNLLIMDSFDFNTEINVNILGHIFEQSISDLEDMKKETTSRRKKDGVYYTPEYITDYICRNTIIPHLSKNGTVTTIHELINEYDNNLSELEEKLRKTTILDPACGSGAFLVKAVDILLEINKEIKNKKEDGNITSDQLQITQEWDEDKEIRVIIENNIYGVDINHESVEITQLSLFLKLVSNDRKLLHLGNYIKVGNSLVDDKTIDPRAFSWENEFPEVLDHMMEDKGFDIIIGNPPYVQLSMEKELDPELKEYLIERYGSSMGRLNTFGFFTSLGIDLLKNNGRLGFIIPNTILTQDYYEELRGRILTSCNVNSIVSFSDLLFQDAVVENVILILQQTDSENERMKNTTTIYGVDANLKFVQQNQIEQQIFTNSKKRTFGISWNSKLLKFREKMDSEGLFFVDYLEINQGIALKHDRAKYIVKDRVNDSCRRILDGREINRYSLTWAGDYLVYDINAIHSCKREDIFITPEKLLFRRTGNSLIATYDDKKFYTLNTLVVMNKKYGVKPNILFFLALFNSKLLNYYYRNFLKSTKKVFSEIQARQVENLPVKIPNENTQEKIIILVKKIIDLKKQLNDTKNKPDVTGMLEEDIIRIDNEINNEIYNIYQLSNSEITIIEKDES